MPPRARTAPRDVDRVRDARHRSRPSRRRPRLEALEARSMLTTILALTAADTLLAFDSGNPGSISRIIPIQGLSGGETISSIDICVYSSSTGPKQVSLVPLGRFRGVEVPVEEGGSLIPLSMGDCKGDCLGVRFGNGSFRNQNFSFITASLMCAVSMFSVVRGIGT